MMEYIFITGTSSGIGYALANLALKTGKSIVHGFSRNRTMEHKNYFHHYADLSKPEQVYAIDFGKFDTADASKIVLFNNAGTEKPIKHLGDADPEEITAAIQLNLATPLILVNNFIRNFKDRKIPLLIINVTSGAASMVYDGWSVYSATKAGLNAATLCASAEAEIDGNEIRIFSIGPGITNTPMQDRIRDSEPSQFSRLEKFVYLKKENKLIPTEEVAGKYLKIIENFDGIKNPIFQL